MRQLTVVVVLGILIHSSVAQGQADPLKKWRELPAHKWQPFAVLYAEVGDAEKVEDGKRVKISKEERTNEALGECFIHLKPLATLTGNFDCALQEEIVASTYISRFGFAPTQIHRVPPEGAKVIMFLGSYSGKYLVGSGPIPFFPKDERNNRPGLLPVENFEDPKVKEVIEALHKLRAKKSTANSKEAK